MSHLFIKHSSKTLLAHLCAFLQTLILPFYFWCWSEVCILLCSMCNFVSKSPVDSRLSEHHPSFLELVVDFTDIYFRVNFISFYNLSVINYRSCCHWLLMSPVVSLDFSMPFCYSSNWLFLLASKLLAFLSKSAPLSSSLCVSSSNARLRMQKQWI